MKIASFLKKLGAKKILIVVCLLLLASFLCIYTLKGRNGDSKTPQTISNPPQKSLTAVEKNGQLKVAGGKLCNEKGTAIQLKGMSSHGLQWFSFSKKTVANLVDNWNVNVVRAAMYTEEGGYIGNEASMKAKVKNIVDGAIEKGIYVIIDWHILSEQDPNTHKEQAKQFFEEMAATYGKYPNVLYEICNEPNGKVTWNENIKPYAEYIIPVIRKSAPNSIIIVGTDTWSQGVRAAADNPLKDPNIMYTMHFYAGTHGQQLRDNADYALSKGAAIFVTEWGTTDSSGSGKLYLDEAKKWVDWMAANKISWCNWSLSNKSEGSAALKPGTDLDGPWKDSMLTESGMWVKSRIMEQ